MKTFPPFTESADGLSCRLTAPCFIQGLDNAREARPIPTTIRRPTVQWKDISRCGRLSLLLQMTSTRCHSVTWCRVLHERLLAKTITNPISVKLIIFNFVDTVSQRCLFSCIIIYVSVLSKLSVKSVCTMLTDMPTDKAAVALGICQV